MSRAACDLTRLSFLATIGPIAEFNVREAAGRRHRLSAFDYATTGQAVEFEAKFEHGFTKIEMDGFDD